MELEVDPCSIIQQSLALLTEKRAKERASRSRRHTLALIDVQRHIFCAYEFHSSVLCMYVVLYEVCVVHTGAGK